MQIYDITIPMRTSLAAWPGDAPYQFYHTLSKRDGSSINLGAVAMSVHAGTHADAPYHFDENGETIDLCDLGIYCGSALVIDVRGRPTIRRDDLPGAEIVGVPRLLFRTDAWLDQERFPESIPCMELGLPQYLGELGVILVGMDVPSVDPLDSKELANHHALAAAGIRILEGLMLADIAPGRYELIALPLKLVGSDGSPVRAILRR